MAEEYKELETTENPVLGGSVGEGEETSCKTPSFGEPLDKYFLYLLSGKKITIIYAIKSITSLFFK